MNGWLKAIEVVLSHEGGYVNDPDDPGGETNFGISKRAFPDVDIANLTEEQAKQIYYDHYWLPHKFQDIDRERIAAKVFDTAINIGPIPAIRILQQSLSKFITGPLVADGKIGSLTIAAIHEAPEDALMEEIKARQAVHYASLNKPKFLLGWMRRAVEG